MVQFQSFEKGIEVNGTTIHSIVDGMGRFSGLSEKYLKDGGLEDVKADENLWYDQQKWLDVFKIISEKIGKSTLYQIGLKIPENSVFPPEIDNINAAFAAMDVIYHMNHRKPSGDILFDSSRDPPLLEGIGHYHYTSEGENKVVIRAENPYPCDVDRGILSAMLKRFSKKAQVQHRKNSECRTNGDEACVYEIEW